MKSAISSGVDRKGRRTQAERTARSDQMMLDAARDQILEVGTGSTTLKEIGERAGYSRGLASARFGSKDRLFVKLAERCRRRWVETLQDAASGKSGLDALVSRLDASLMFAQTHPDDARAMYILWFESVGAPSEINASLARFHEQARADIKALAVEAGIVSGRNSARRAERYAAQLCGTIFGLVYQWVVDPESVDLQSNLEDIRSELLSHRRGRRPRRT